jgi:urea transport system ATP-binding protein
MTDTEKILSIKNLTVSFDGFKAVDSLDLDISKNELRVIIGPNGAGKTTVLDLICGKTKSTQGSIKFKNQEISRMSEHRIVRAGIGRKFQNPAIYENLTVEENLEVSYPSGRTVFGSLTFVRTPEVNESIAQMSEGIYLKDYLNVEAGLLSHGQKQWLEIGMLLMQDPDLLMLDEPVAGMSAKERGQTAELLNKICKNRSILVIEHDMEFVKKIAHRVTVLHLGKIIADGEMSEIQNNPKVIEVYLGH